MLGPDDPDAIDHSAFYPDPTRYDLITAALSGDAPAKFYKALAMRYGSPVLELAAGTGRIAVPIALEGIEIFGLDASKEMLRTASRRARASCARITWVCADMRNFDLCREFQFIFVASNSFSHLYSRADIETCLSCVRRHLAPSGRFVVQVFNPALGLFVGPSDRRMPVATYVDRHSGREVTVSKCVRYDSATQISHETWYFQDELTGQEDQVPLNLRMFFPQEIDAILHYNGFSIEQKYGDEEDERSSIPRARRSLCALHSSHAETR